MSGRVFFISDLHIGHRFVAGLRWNNLCLEGREINPREAIDDIIDWHDNMLAKNWDRVVNPDGDRNDQVWVLGDISGGGSKSQERALAWLIQRPGTKHLICGNHDGCHPMNRDAHKWQRKYLGVFDSVQMAARRKIGTKYILLSHFPYAGAGDRGPEERYPQWRLPDEGMWLMHGHTHAQERQDGKSIHVGVDAHNFTPVPLEDIATIVNGGV